MSNLISDKLSVLKSSLCTCESLSLEEYDRLYGDVEEIQHLLVVEEETDEQL